MSTYSKWLVVATRPGIFDHVWREPFEVFALLDIDEDGSYPAQVRRVERKGPDGKPVTDEYGDVVVDEVPVLGADGKPLHRDFAEDLGESLLTRGPMKGEVLHLGWQLRVPDHTPCGLYPEGTDFWAGEPAPPHRKPVVATKPLRAKGSTAPIRGSRARPVQEQAP